MNNIKLLVRNTIKPQKKLATTETELSKVLCIFQRIDKKDDRLKFYMPIEKFLYFFGNPDEIILTDTYYLEFEIDECIDNDITRTTSFTFNLLKAINLTEGNYGEKTLQNVRNKPVIRSIKTIETSQQAKQEAEKSINEVIMQQKTFQAISDVVNSSITNADDILDVVPDSLNEQEQDFELAKTLTQELLYKPTVKPKSNAKESKKSKEVEKSIEQVIKENERTASPEEKDGNKTNNFGVIR